ncbi:MAG TPA: cytochrome P450 [Candidatus Limnocylindrales bacterium]|nr:cytochrome P450 [Candidatus Limnocylindrales bacterium]
MSTAHSGAHDDPARADAAFLTLIMDPEVRRDPYPTLHEVRSASPIFKSSFGNWVLTRYDDCHSALRDPRCGKDWPGMMERAGFDDWREHQSLGYGDSTLLFANPPQHTRLRRLVARAFTPRTVERLKPRMAATVDKLLDPLVEAGGGDLLDALAFPLPVTVIGDLLGVPEADRAPFREGVRLNTRTLEMNVTRADVEAADASVAWMSEYFHALLADKRRSPCDDMMSGMAQAEEGGDRLSDDEIVGMSLLLFGAGFETTTNLIGNGVHHLLGHPDQIDVLRADPSLVPNAIEELVRFDGSILLSGRAAFEDIEIAGHRIRAGEGIVTILGAANRDPARYPDPDTLDVRRKDIEPLSFGSGIHFCLGANLARGEAVLAIGRLLERCPKLAAAGDAHFRDQFVFRGLESLPISC